MSPSQSVKGGWKNLLQKICLIYGFRGSCELEVRGKKKEPHDKKISKATSSICNTLKNHWRKAFSCHLIPSSWAWQEANSDSLHWEDWVQSGKVPAPQMRLQIPLSTTWRSHVLWKKANITHNSYVNSFLWDEFNIILNN